MEFAMDTKESRMRKDLKNHSNSKERTLYGTISRKKPPQLTENALRVLEKRYLRKDVDGKIIETPVDLFRRVAKNIAQADLRYDPETDIREVEDEFYNMMANLEFLPNSPTLMNAGAKLQQLSACFVLPVEDSMANIFESVKNTALIHQSGGGTGFSFSRVRPKDDLVSSTMGRASGPVSFMTVFDAATETIKQGGTRRGANMGILRVDHPDIMDFIFCKEHNNRLNNFNISVALTADFMNALEADREYDLINPRTGKLVGKLKAKEVFDKIVEMAWKNGDPGIIYLDRINKHNPTPHIGNIEATNPCGEQPLLPYESCNLGSINLSRMFTDTAQDRVFAGGVDYERLKRVVRRSVHFLDNVIDMNQYPLHKIKEMTHENRKIGLGVMGWADLLIKLGIPYNSEDAIKLAGNVMVFIQEESKKASEYLAEKRGVFPNYKGSLLEKQGIKVRNATITTIAPTGTISIIAGCSSGIEPLYAISFERNVLDGARLIDTNPLFEEIAKRRGYYSQELIDDVAKRGTLKNLKNIPDDIKRIFVTAHDITPEWHIRMQTAFQKYTDNAVSKTVNFPHNATKEDVAEVYKLAYFLGCKGVTVYRDGSRDVQVLNMGADSNVQKSDVKDQELEVKGQIEEDELIEEPGYRPSVQESRAGQIKGQDIHIIPTPRPRGDITFGATRKIKTGCGNLYVTINEDENGRPFEIFNQMGKAGGCAASQSEAIGRLVSLALRSGIKPDLIIKQLKAISCHLPAWQSGGKVLSCSDGIAKAIEWYLNYRSHVNHVDHADKGIDIKLNSKPFDLGSTSSKVSNRGACPDCGGTVEHVEGCVVCRACGYTECE